MSETRKPRWRTEGYGNGCWCIRDIDSNKIIARLGRSRDVAEQMTTDHNAAYLLAQAEAALEARFVSQHRLGI